MSTVNFYLYNSKASKPTLITLRFRYDQKLLVYSTREKIHPKQWNKKKKRARTTGDKNSYTALNDLLNKLEDVVLEKYRNSKSSGLSLSNADLIQTLNQFLKIDCSTLNEAQNKVLSFLDYLKLFIDETRSGIRRKNNGDRITESTIRGYEVLQKHLINFRELKKFDLRLPLIINSSNQELLESRKYWKRFYDLFTDYLYDDLNNYDNSVGAKIKNLKVFLNYLKKEKYVNISDDYQSFYAPREEPEIQVLSLQQLNYLITSKELEDRLPIKLKRVKDIFVFGCTVALRVSDLLSLKEENIKTSDGTPKNGTVDLVQI